jgi:uncharacterized repeat protein (TIGR01451 family)
VPPIPSGALAARAARRLRVVALLALLLAHIAPALAISAGQARSAPVERWPGRLALAAAGVAATQVDALLVDVNGNQRADPGDTLRYTVVIDNASGADISGLAFEETLDPSATLVAGSLRIGPQARADNYEANRDSVLAIGAPGLLANDAGTPAPSALARSVTTAAGGTATTAADGSFSYTPPPSYTGIDSFTYSANNSAGSDAGLVTLTVRAGPLAADDGYTIVQDSARSIPAPGVLANDMGFPPPSVAPFTGATAAGGAVSLAANGGFSYSPPSGFAGIDSFDYTAGNSAGSDTATVTLTVGLAPLAQPDTGYSTLLGAQLNVPAGAGTLGNDTLGSPAATVISFGGGDLAGTTASNVAGATASFGSGGALKLNADGSFDFTPSAGFAGAFSFGYRISNLFGTSDALATIAVRQIPAITSADAITFTVGVTSSFNITTIGFPTPAITQTGALPVGLSFVDNSDGTATLGGTPGIGSEGSYPLTFDASNLFGSSATQSFTLTVKAAGLMAHQKRPGIAAPLSVGIGALPNGKQVTIIFDLLIADPLPIGVSRIVNQGAIVADGIASAPTDDPRRPGAADPTITFMGTRQIFMPMMIRAAGPPLADLVVESISSAAGKLSVTVRNNGPAAVADPFWIDLYIAPNTAPLHANQLWSDVGSRGASWGVIDDALPLAPGARLTVSLGDIYYRPLLSNPGDAVAAGTQLYAQVDSFNSNGANGAVLETHEREGAAYNNILGPVAAGAP